MGAYLLDPAHVLRLLALPASGRLVAHPLALRKAPEPATLYGRVVDEKVLAPLIASEKMAETFARGLMPEAFSLGTTLLTFGLATVGWTDRDLVPEVHAKEGKCPEPDRRTRRNFAARRSGWFELRTRSTPYPG